MTVPRARAPGVRVRAPRPGRLYRLGRLASRRGWAVVIVWVVLLVAATVGHRALGGAYSDDFTLPGSPSQAAAALLQRHAPAAGTQTSQLVFTVPSGTLQSESSAIESARQAVAALPHVVSVTDPLASVTTSKDGRTAYATVALDANPVTLGSSFVDDVDTAVAPARAAGVRVDYGGLLGQAARPKANDLASETIGIVVAIVVLLVGFGSVIAAGLPIVSALVGVATGLGVLGMVATAATFGSVAPTLALMMGLGVGIDYALFLTTRHRQQLMDGAEPTTAAARTVSTSGRAVLIAAITVVIAMVGLYASGIHFIGRLGLAAAITVAVAAAAGLTLVPALLGLVGRAIDRWHVRTPVAEASTVEGSETVWHRYTRHVESHPWRFLLAGVAALLVLAVPVLSMRLGHVDAGAGPHSYTDRRAYDALESAFGPGANGPFTVVVRLPADMSSSDARQLAGHVSDQLAAVSDVAAPPQLQRSQDGVLLYGTLVPSSGPQDARTDRLMSTLRDRSLPDALRGSGATGYVTGSLAGQLDFRDRVSARLIVIIAVVVAAAFLLLLVTFRSPVIAIKAALLNLLSIGASYGVVVAVFQWGWGSSLIGVHEKVPVESYVPMMMFAIVFGLSMDYEVFLLSRIREGWLHTGDNTHSVAHGLASTARVISCAALIMTSVFLAFLLSKTVVVKMLALGLGVSVLIDATLIRLIVVPASMFLLDRANWWIPGWLDRVLPRLDPEGSEGAAGSEGSAGPEPARAEGG